MQPRTSLFVRVLKLRVEQFLMLTRVVPFNLVQHALVGVLHSHDGASRTAGALSEEAFALLQRLIANVVTVPHRRLLRIGHEWASRTVPRTEPEQCPGRP